MDLKNFIDGIAITAEKNIGRNENDFEENGILICGNCRTPKQHILKILDEDRKVFCLCKCELEKRRKAESVKEEEKRQGYIYTLRKDGIPEQELQKWTFDNDDNANERVSNIAKKYVENFDTMRNRGKGLIFYGTVGTGKTFLSVCIANALIDKGIPCLVTDFAKLTRELTGLKDGKQKYIDSLNNYELIVIDDLASERDTEYMGEIIQTIIDSRYRAGLPLIITTNLSGEEITKPKDIRKQRIFSRIYEMCIPVEVKGNDRRREKLKSDYQEFSGLLGL